MDVLLEKCVSPFYVKGIILATIERHSIMNLIAIVKIVENLLIIE
jgi:hypothetical protein